MASVSKALWRSKLRRLRVATVEYRTRRPCAAGRTARASEPSEAPEAADPGAREQIRCNARAPKRTADSDPEPVEKRRRGKAKGHDIVEEAPRPPQGAAASSRLAQPRLARVSAPHLLALPDGAAADARPSRVRGPVPPTAPPPPERLDPGLEIHRILAAENPEEILRLDGACTESAVLQAWKRLVLLLHPDKLRRLTEAQREEGAEALHRVHGAKEELRERSQKSHCEVPWQVQGSKEPRLLCGESGSRKYELLWDLPEVSDPNRPIEKYEIWGPRYFSEVGEPFDWCLLATVPPLQNAFVIVEEAPTQQDVMWATDRVRRATLPLDVYAVNGAGPSEALHVELPWLEAFPWLEGTASVLCGRCFALSPCLGPWSPCSNCRQQVSVESRLVIRCPDCQGEALWTTSLTELACSCCLRSFARAAEPQVLLRPRPPTVPPVSRAKAAKAVHAARAWHQARGNSGRARQHSEHW